MKKGIILLIAVLLTTTVVFATLAQTYKSPFQFPRTQGVERVTHYDPRVNYPRINEIIYFEPAAVQSYEGVGRGGYVPKYARGAGRVSSSDWYGYPKTQITFSTIDIKASDKIKMQYEGWLVDTDTGYRTSIGTFTTGFGGVGELRYKVNNYIFAYDLIEVTLEPFDDDDARPGPAVLVAPLPRGPNIPPPGFFDPAPAQKRLLTQTYSKI